MPRKRKPEEPDNPDRWVVSYADFVTLLFAFFTTLYAISHVDLGKLERFRGSLKQAFKADHRDTVEGVVIEGIRPPNYADLALEQDLQGEIKKFGIIEGVIVSREERGVVLSLADTLLFEPGSADIRKTALPFLAAVADFSRKRGRAVMIEGHTDNLPLRNSRYASNVELSAVRAAAAYAVLLGEDPAAAERLSTAGYGEYRPVASNASPEGRAKNRRVDIIFAAQKNGT